MLYSWSFVGGKVAAPSRLSDLVNRSRSVFYGGIAHGNWTLHCGDNVIVRSRSELPRVVKISNIFWSKDRDQKMISVLPFLRPEHSRAGRQPHHGKVQPLEPSL